VQYCSRRGFARTLWYRSLHALGRYRAYRRVDWKRVRRLIFVCKGNICRSPYAEVIAKSEGLDAISCGLEAADGAQANPAALEAASRKGRDLSAHKSRPVTSITAGEGDLFIVMEPGHVEALDKFLGKESGCTLLGIWDRPGDPYIQDPYGADAACFDRSFSLIERSVREIAREIQKAKND
jgi:protein-tyrosine phosphatase